MYSVLAICYDMSDKLQNKTPYSELNQLVFYNKVSVNY